MSKIALLSVLFAITLTVQGQTSSPYDDIIQAANSGDWDKFQALLFKKFGTSGWKEVNLDNVRSLKPPSGGHVYGESEYTFHSSSDLGGEKKVETGGHKIINEDGKVEEFDFKPKFDQNPLISLQNKFSNNPVELKPLNPLDLSNQGFVLSQLPSDASSTPSSFPEQSQIFGNKQKTPKSLFNYPYF